MGEHGEGGGESFPPGSSPVRATFRTIPLAAASVPFKFVDLILMKGSLGRENASVIRVRLLRASPGIFLDQRWRAIKTGALAASRLKITANHFSHPPSLPPSVTFRRGI